MQRTSRVPFLVGAFLAIMALSGVGVATAATPATPSTVPSTPQQKVAALTLPSIVYLKMDLNYWVRTDTGSAIGPYELQVSCTGAFVSTNGYVETASHCVNVQPGSDLWDLALQNALQTEVAAGTITQADSDAALPRVLGNWKVEGLAAGSTGTLVVNVSSALDSPGQTTGGGATARVVETKAFEDGDVALLKVEETNTPVLLLGSDNDVNIGTGIMSVGYPQAEQGNVDQFLSTPTFKDGQINSKTTTGNLRLPVYETSAALSHGMSGGPTVTLDGKLIGINSSTSTLNQNFDFVAPVSLVTEQLARNAVSNQLGPADSAYRDGLDAYFSGNYQQAIDKFNEALGVVPTHIYAQQYKQKATEQLASAPPTTAPSSSSSSSTAPIAIGALAVLLLVVVGVVVFFVTRRRGKAAPPTTAEAVMAPPPAPLAYGVAPSPGAPPAYGVAPPPGAPPAYGVAPPPGAPPTTGPLTAPVPPQPAGPVIQASPPVATTAAATDTTTSGDEPVAFCSSCGHHAEADERFCPSCGHDLHAHG
jgi:serine protease Do